MSVSRIVVTPSWRCDPGLAIAAARAGAWGLLDLGVTVAERDRAAALARLARQAETGLWGVRWDTLGRPERSTIPIGDRRIPALLIAGVAEPALAGTIEAARGLAEVVWIEARSAEGARAAGAAGCDGVVVRAAECGGAVGDSPGFILLQRLGESLPVPCWVQAAWGPDTAAAATAAGVGIVLSEELWLTREAPWDTEERDSLSRVDGADTVVVGRDGRHERVAIPGGADAVMALQRRIDGDESWPELLYSGPLNAPGACRDGVTPVPLGAGIAFAGALARRHVTVAGILDAYRAAAESLPGQAASRRALAPGGPLAAANGTRYPVLQGPMTRVSDVADFCDAVADSGGLPFLALALLRGPSVRRLIEETAGRLGDKPWGIGILGFVPPELRNEQLEAVQAHPPRFALIAGGRPAQARALEEQGIATYLHAPSPNLLRMFLKQGARRFILEGRECGGHVGPRSSLVLWQSAVDLLADAEVERPEDVHVVFAGGIHDARSAALVSVLADRLAARGMRVGVLMGTAYLFTEEAVRCGAITPVYQQEAIDCSETVLLASGFGHATRCARTPFAEEFERRRREMIQEERPADEIRLELEMLNVGRLRVASKGLARKAEAGATRDAARRRIEAEGQAGANPSHGTESRQQKLERGAALLEGRLETVDESTQRRQGMYMIGEVATLRDGVTTVEDLHASVSDGAVDELARLAGRSEASHVELEGNRAAREPVAIIGMACRFPGAADLTAYWRNIVAGVDAVREVPEDRWSSALYFTDDRLDRDRIYSRWGAFLEPARFDPVRYGIPPSSVGKIDPVQLLTLDVCRQAMENAGYGERPFPRERTAAIFASGGVGDLGIAYALRTMLPQALARVGELDEATRQIVIDRLRETLPSWSEDSFPGVLVNVLSGRVANRLDLKGSNFVVDAACAASLAAVQTAMEQLRSGSCDMALVGAADGTNNAFTFTSFARTHALTPSGRLRAFDDAADGIVLGEGIAAVVLKRLSDAERDGDRIWSVIRGIGSSSDGRNRSLTAPHPDSQALAIRRGWDDAGLEPATVSLVEAHATGTAVGDRSEIAAMRQVFGERDARGPTCAVGSVKTMIGHTKTVAGLAGLIKTSLSLAHRVLPPTLNVETPNRAADFPSSPFYINTEPRPWMRVASDAPRRAGVSAFGFGGTNFHAVMEEYDADPVPSRREDLTGRGAEPFLWTRPDTGALDTEIGTLLERIAAAPSAPLQSLAAAHARGERRARPGGARLAVVAGTVNELRQRLVRAREILRQAAPDTGGHDGTDLFWSTRQPVSPEQVCFLYPGQGAQRVGMLGDLMQGSAYGSGLMEAADRQLEELLHVSLASVVYPPPAFTREERKAQKAALDDTRVAQPALGVANLFATDVLASFGISPAFAAGHSYGEYVALCVAGLNDRRQLLRVSVLRGQAVHEAGRENPGGMLAVAADGESTRRAIAELGLQVEPANFNAPRQTIVAGTLPAIEDAARKLSDAGLAVRRVAVTAPFHTSAMEGPARSMAGHLRDVPMASPRLPVYSNVTAEPHVADVDEIRRQLALHLARPVRFVELVQALHRDGARLFIEAGPGRILTGLVRHILEDRSHEAIPLDGSGPTGWVAVARLLARVHVAGLPVDLRAWFAQRDPEPVTVREVIDSARRDAEIRPTDWWLSPGGARPATADAAGSVRASVPASRPDPAPTSVPDTRVVPPADGGPSIMTGRSAPEPGRSPILSQDSDHKNLPSGESGRALERLQESLGGWLDMQKEQQRLSARFLALQERVAAGLLGQPVPSEDSRPDSRSGAAVSREIGAADAPAAAFGVAPAPVLPDLPGASVPSSSPVSSPPGAPATGTPTATSPALDVAPATVTAAPSGPDAGGPAAASTPAEGGAASVEMFHRDLVREVSARTGYPEDMLDLDVPLEAGLGIDSIKTMEIFSALKPHHGVLADDDQDEEEILVQFTQMKTLRDIIDHYAARLTPGEATPSVTGADAAGAAGDDEGKSDHRDAAAPTPVAGAAATADEGGMTVTALPVSTPTNGGASAVGMHNGAKVERLILRSVPAPSVAGGSVAGTGMSFPAEDVLLVLGEAPELATSLQAALAAAGIRAIHVLPGQKTRRLAPDRFEVNLTRGADVRRLAEELRRDGVGCVGGLVNLLTLSDSMRKRGLNGLQAPLRLVRWLTNVARTFETDIRASSERGGGWLLNVTTLDGRFGLRARGELPVAQAGSLGFFKSLAREWRGTRVKNVDLDPQADPQALVVGLMQELSTWDDAIEVGIDGEGRWRLELEDAPLGKGSGVDLTAGLDPDAVVLATGGARGITAEVLKDMARRTGARLVVVGRTPEPVAEPPAMKALKGAAELRAHLLQEMRAADPTVLPAQVESRVTDILRNRSILRNLDAFRHAGSVVEYHAVDVRDGKAFGALIDQIYKRHGRIDGVIHGAGQIEDRWLKDKTMESLARVFETKVNGALILARRLRPESLRFLAFFSSVSGRFGNAGQTDYSAANECLNKLAAQLDRSWPARVVSLAWGPWDAGMVPDGLRAAYRRRGIEMISVASGVRSFVDEIAHLDMNQPEVVLTCTPERIAAVTETEA